MTEPIRQPPPNLAAEVESRVREMIEQLESIREHLVIIRRILMPADELDGGDLDA